MIDYFASADTPRAAAVRARWGIARQLAGAVSIEADSTKCSVAYQAFDSVWQGGAGTGRSVVLRVAHLRATMTEESEITTANMPFLITDTTFTNVVELFWP